MKRKLNASETAAVLTAAAQSDEPPVTFDASHYGSLGLNGRFESSDAIGFFAGGEDGGGGMFENAETRDIAGATGPLLSVFEEHGLIKGSTVLDVGAGTGLMLKPLSSAVGPDGKVLAVDLSARFVAYMRRRAQKHGLANVRVSRSSARSTELPSSSRFRADLALLLDVYHHVEYPQTFMRSVRAALREGGRLVLVDFYRDPKKMVTHEGSWALAHIRADKDVFVAEIVKAGFRMVAEPEIDALKENYVVIFERTAG